MIKTYIKLAVFVFLAFSCTKKVAAPSMATGPTPIDLKDEQNDIWIAQKYAKKLGVKTEETSRNIRLYHFINSWENAPCVKDSEKDKENDEEKKFDPSWFYEKTMADVFNLKTKPAKDFSELQEKKLYLFYGKNFLNEGDVLYFSSYHINIDADLSLSKHNYDLAATGIYLTNNYFMTCNNKEKKVKIVNMVDTWKGDSLSAAWDKHFIAAERPLQDK